MERVSVAHCVPDLVHLLLQHILNLPVCRHSCDAKEEAPERGDASLAVLHLRVVLQPVQLLLPVLYCYDSALHSCDTGISLQLPLQHPY